MLEGVCVGEEDGDGDGLADESPPGARSLRPPNNAPSGFWAWACPANNAISATTEMNFNCII